MVYLCACVSRTRSHGRVESVAYYQRSLKIDNMSGCWEVELRWVMWLLKRLLFHHMPKSISSWFVYQGCNGFRLLQCGFRSLIHGAKCQWYCSGFNWLTLLIFLWSGAYWSVKLESDHMQTLKYFSVACLVHVGFASSTQIEAGRKFPPVCRRYSQLHFLVAT